MLKPQIRTILDQIISAKFPGGWELSFGKSKIDLPSTQRNPPESGNVGSLTSDKVADIFWLGYDVMWSVDATLRGADKSRILHGVRQSIHHASEVGLAGMAEQLGEIYETISAAKEAEISAEWRDQLAIKLNRIADQIGAITEKYQNDFRPNPSVNS